MRIYKTLTREFLSQYTDALRKRLDLTQEKMAESLRITYRAYGDLERGKYCFSAASLLFLLLLLEDEEVLDLLKVSVKPKGVWNTPTTHERIRL